MKRTTNALLVWGAILPFVTGCLVVVADDGSWSWGGPRVYTTATDERTLDTTGLTALEVRTHNGTIDFTGQDSGEATVSITKKAGGLTEADAQEAMDAIEVFIESGGGTTRIGWRWNVPKHPRWSGDVSFAVRAPRNIRLEAETHNGAIEIAAVAGDVCAETHNGEIKVASGNGSLYAESHNGAIQATYAGPKLTLVTHNGEVVADISECGAVRGDVTTHNGGVRLSVGDETSAAVHCRTHNGEVSSEAPLSGVEKSRGKLTGTLGSGAGKLDISTHNGGIRLQRSST